MVAKHEYMKIGSPAILSLGCNQWAGPYESNFVATKEKSRFARKIFGMNTNIQLIWISVVQKCYKIHHLSKYRMYKKR